MLICIDIYIHTYVNMYTYIHYTHIYVYMSKGHRSYLEEF